MKSEERKVKSGKAEDKKEAVGCCRLWALSQRPAKKGEEGKRLHWGGRIMAWRGGNDWVCFAETMFSGSINGQR